MPKTWYKHSTPHVHLRDKYRIAQLHIEHRPNGIPLLYRQCLKTIPPKRRYIYMYVHLHIGRWHNIICTYKHPCSCVSSSYLTPRLDIHPTKRTEFTHNMNQQINIDFICEIYAHLIIFTQPHNYVGVDMASRPTTKKPSVQVYCKYLNPIMIPLLKSVQHISRDAQHTAPNFVVADTFIFFFISFLVRFKGYGNVYDRQVRGWMQFSNVSTYSISVCIYMVCTCVSV